MIEGGSGRFGMSCSFTNRPVATKAGAHGGRCAGGGRDPLPPASRPDESSPLMRTLSSTRDPSAVGRNGGGATASSVDGAERCGRRFPTRSWGRCRARRLGITERFSAHYGSQQALMEDSAISTRPVLARRFRVCGAVAAMSIVPASWLREDERALAETFVRRTAMP